MIINVTIKSTSVYVAKCNSYLRNVFIIIIYVYQLGTGGYTQKAGPVMWYIYTASLGVAYQMSLRYMCNM